MTAPTPPPPDRSAFLDLLAERALRPDADVLGQVLTVASGAIAVGVSSEDLIERVQARTGGAS